jgi:uroporphyrinogen decarboxylase
VIDHAQPTQTGCSKDGRLRLAFGQLAQPRLHIAAERDHIEVRPRGLQLRLAPQAGRADDRAVRQVGDARERPDQAVARILALEEGGQIDVVGQG